MVIASKYRSGFSTDQLKELDRFSESEFEDLVNKTIEGDTRTTQEKQADTDKIIARLKTLSVSETKCRVNLSGVSGDIPVYSNANNYTAQEQADIAKIVSHDKSKWGSRIPDRLSKVAAMRSASVDESVIDAILTS